MISHIRNNLWIPLSFAVIFLVTVVFRPLLPIDETRYLSVAWEMLLRQDWLAPLTVNGQPYHHKPPFLFWAINTVWLLTGPSRWAATIVPALMGMSSVFLTMLLTEKLFPRDTQRASRVALIMMGCLPYLVYSSMIMFDVTMTFFVLLTLLALVAFSQAQKWRYIIFMSLMLGLGILTKGPVAYLYTIFPMLLGPLWHRYPLSKLKWYGSCFSALLLSIIPVLFWLIPVLRQSDDHFAFWLVWEQTAGRITGNFNAAHARPFYFYVPIIVIFMMPWIFFPKFWTQIMVIKSKISSDPGVRFILCWIIPVFISFSIISGKQPHYLVPIIPGMAIIIAVLLQDLKMATLKISTRLLILIFVLSHAVGAQTLFKDYDLMPIARYVEAHPDDDWAYTKKYHGEVTFLAHRIRPIDVVQPEAIEAWFTAHPSGYAIIGFKDIKQFKNLTLVMDIPYRGKRMGVFKREIKKSRSATQDHAMAVPKILPISAVAPIATMPQNIMRNAGFNAPAPLIFAATAPRIPKRAMLKMATTGKIKVEGRKKIVSTGSPAPKENAVAEAKAACNGLAVVRSLMPSSSRA